MITSEHLVFWKHEKKPVFLLALSFFAPQVGLELAIKIADYQCIKYCVCLLIVNLIWLKMNVINWNTITYLSWWFHFCFHWFHLLIFLMVDIVILFNAESVCRGLKRALFFILMIGIQNVELLCIAMGKI